MVFFGYQSDSWVSERSDHEDVPTRTIVVPSAHEVSMRAILSDG